GSRERVKCEGWSRRFASRLRFALSFTLHPSPVPTMLRLLAVLVLLAPAALAQDTLLTRAEATGYRATSAYADVTAFVERIAERPGFRRTTFGETVEGRALPLVVWGEETTEPEAVRSNGKLRVLVFANIHAGEVAGKE